MTGIITETERSRFERALFRSTRGNCYARFASIEHPMYACLLVHLICCCC